MTWYALPDAYLSHSQITQTFTWVIYTALTAVSHSSLPTSFDVYIDVTGQELAFPTWTTTPANLQTDGVVSESNFSYKKTYLFSPNSVY
jgi:hypothetical protein